MSEQQYDVQEPKQDIFSEVTEQDPAQDKKRKQSFIKRHPVLIACFLGLIAICVIVLAAFSAVRANQARQIAMAQIGKCYMIKYAYSATTYTPVTEIYYFTEGHYAKLQITYTSDQTGISAVTGSLESSIPLDISISFSGKVRLDGTEIVLDERNNIVSSNLNTRIWEPISLTDAQELQTYARHMVSIYEACRYAQVDTSGFLKNLNYTLNYTYSPYTTTPSDADCISAAKTLINKQLKNPSTAVYNAARVAEKDNYGRAIVYLDVSAQNSFGGYVRNQYYVCITGITTDGKSYTYNPNFFSLEADKSLLLSSLKSINNWNEDRNDNTGIADYTPGQAEKTNSVTVNHTSLDRYEFTSTNAKYVIYIEPISKYVISSEIIVSKAKFNSLDSSQRAILGKAIRGTMQGVDGLTDWTEIFDIETGIITREPYFKDGCCYHAVEKEGNYHITITNIDALRCTKVDYWTPVK